MGRHCPGRAYARVALATTGVLAAALAVAYYLHQGSKDAALQQRHQELLQQIQAIREALELPPIRPERAKTRGGD